MFSWSKSSKQGGNGGGNSNSNGNGNGNSGGISRYPAQRPGGAGVSSSFHSSNNSASSSSTGEPVVAQTIQGSIRAPEYTRAKHLESYLNDPTLQRSTRKVSAGKFNVSWYTS